MNILEEYEAAGFVYHHKHGNEYYGECPVCGGKDRFCLWYDDNSSGGRFWCRRCNRKGFADSFSSLLGKSDNVVAPYKRRYSTLNNTLYVKGVPDTLPDNSYFSALDISQQNLKDSTRCVLAKIYLSSRGISLETAIKYGLGYIRTKTPYTNCKTGEVKACPSGIVIPNYRNGTLRSIKVRTMSDFSDESESQQSKYALLGGCPSLPYILRTDERINTPILIVESELDAILLAQELGTLFNYVALGTANAKSDVEISKMIASSSKVYFCPDYDEAGIAAFRNWQQQYPKIELALLPRGKDPTDALLSGVDLKQWGKQLRGITPAEPKITRVQEFSYRHIDSEEELTAFLNIIRSAENPVLAVLADSKQNLLAFSDGRDNTAVTEITFSKIDLTGIKLITFDPLQFRCVVSAPVDMPPLHNLQYLYRALFGPSKDKTLRDISMHFLGYRGGEDPLYLDAKQNPKKELAGDVRALYQLCQMLFKKLKLAETNTATKSYYNLLCSAQPAVSQAMQTGLLVDWNAFESAGGMEKSKDIARHRDSDDRVRCIFNPCSIITGRIVSRNANLQGFPKELRHTVIAPEGYVLVDADYKQSELRIAAQLAHDTKMVYMLVSGKDVYTESISQICHISLDKVTPELRSIGKAVNFAFLYGSSAKGLSDNLALAGITKTKEQCEAFLKHFARMYPRLSQWKEEEVLQLNPTKDAYPPFCVRTALGRIIPVNTMNYSFRTKQVNYAVQGTGVDLLLIVLSRLPKALQGLDAKIIHIVHDEILLEVAEQDASVAANALEDTMCDAFQALFKGASVENLVEVSIGKSWSKG